MSQIKIFEGDEEAVINEWLKNNSRITVIDIKRYPMFDYYDNGDVCNRWSETMIIYKKITTFGDVF